MILIFKHTFDDIITVLEKWYIVLFGTQIECRILSKTPNALQ